MREETQSYVRTLLRENSELREAVVELTSENERLGQALRARDEQKSELPQKIDELRAVRARASASTTSTASPPRPTASWRSSAWPAF